MSVSGKLLPLCVLVCLASFSAYGQKNSGQDSTVRLNQIQVIGTHNSYHAGIAPSETKLWQQKNPKALHGLEYHHAPLPEQFSAGVRQIELDIFADPKGGLYADPAGPHSVKEAGLPADPPYDPQGLMKQPGFKVLHVQDFDYRSTCETFVGCLKSVRDWSKANPGHLPIFILVETKDEALKSKISTIHPEAFTPQLFDALDQEILSVFSKDEIITPDSVRGSYATLPEAIKNNSWPTVAQARGKVIFLLDQRKIESVYTEGHPALKGRILFTNAVPGAPDAAFTEQNEGSLEEINALVEQGYLVRTRTDANTEEARTNDTSRRDLVLKSGAQMLSTDYPASEPSSWTGYSVSFPGGVIARCNPVLKPVGCKDEDLDHK